MKVFTFETLDSTNTYLKEQYQKYPNGSVILALNQTQGRGRFDRVWESTSDLTFSILFKTKTYNHHLIAPLSIVKALKKYQIDAKIKWPNDIYVQNQKLSGILIECMYVEKKFLCEIVGIGVNITPKEPSLNATYCEIERLELLQEILEQYESLLHEDEDNLLDLYYKNSYVLYKKVIYKNKEYKIIGFDKELHLILDDGQTQIQITASEIDLKSAIIKA